MLRFLTGPPSLLEQEVVSEADTAPATHKRRLLLGELSAGERTRCRAPRHSEGVSAVKSHDSK